MPEKDAREGPADAGSSLRAALRDALARADAALASVEGGGGAPMARREAVRTARRALKEVRAIAPLCRVPGRDDLTDGVLEFAGKANQLLGPLRDRDALARSIQRLSERFADAETRRVARTVLMATLVFSESDRRDETAFADAAIERARRALRSARQAADASARGLADGAIDGAEAASVVWRHAQSLHEELSEALRRGDLARLHECRKLASLVALSLSPLGELPGGPLRRLRSRARRLASALGDDRDLALLDVEMHAARARLAGSPLIDAIDGTLRLARVESGARMEDAARHHLRLRIRRVKRELDRLFE